MRGWGSKAPAYSMFPFKEEPSHVLNLSCFHTEYLMP